ncbi:theronine dehydrogenase [Klebsiella quasipneumoniae]|uniref:theronine dehydrogenase n=1 Tax=Klebsiella quasipneumoniae TaxID=1463165 RepID=UPI001F40D5B3|nr:theronine dehydrogenase [Klebsiella quasipneumoniae]
MKRRYSLRWKLPHRPCPGPHELVSEVVGAGQPAPESLMARWVAGARYAVCGFPDERQIRRWSDERKAAARRRNLERRVNRIAPLFADELIEWELETRPEYFRGKSAR